MLDRHVVLPSQMASSRPDHWLYALCEKILEDVQRLLMEGKRRQERNGHGVRALRLDIREALAWIQADGAVNRYDPFNFIAVCELLNRDPDRTRKTMIAFWLSDTNCEYSYTDEQTKASLCEYVRIHPGVNMVHIHRAIRGGTGKHIQLILDLVAEGELIRVKDGNFWRVYPVEKEQHAA